MYTKISKRKQGSPCKNFTKDALRRQILTDSIAKNPVCVEVTHFLAQYLNKTNILTCVFKQINNNKVPRAKILIQNVLKRQILTDFTANI